MNHKIKSFEGACKVLKRDPKKLPAVSRLPKKMQRFIISTYKLATIVEAMNKLSGFVADWANSSQYKYYPYFVRKLNAKGLFSGFAFAYSNYDWTYTYTYGGSRFAVGSSAEAEYLGKQFLPLYNDILTV